jgi:hypothetical protein
VGFRFRKIFRNGPLKHRSLKKELGIQVKDLEEKLHYNNILSPYPYYEIPLDALAYQFVK